MTEQRKVTEQPNLTEPPDLEQQIAGISSLNEPVRRALYQYVGQRGGDVSRDDAAAAVGISRGLAAFHLDKLVEEGLLEVTFRRLSGRSGPGAGRPSKLYRRSSRQIELTLPPRSYELAARLFADALEGEDLRKVAHEFGGSVGMEARAIAGQEAGREKLLDSLEAVLTAYGFEPYHNPNGELRMRNCPFHALAQRHRVLVCGMNLALMEGALETLRSDGVEAVLDPRPGECCVAFREARNPA